MKIELGHVFDLGDDVLKVTGTIDGEPVEAFGWVSAMTNHFDPEDYGPADGLEGLHLLPDATPREMTADEKRAYCERLLAEAVPAEAAEPTPLDLAASLT